MIEVKKDTRQGFAIKLTLNSGSNYLTEAAALELRDKLITILPSTPPIPDPRDALIEIMGKAIEAAAGSIRTHCIPVTTILDGLSAWQKLKEEGK